MFTLSFEGVSSFNLLALFTLSSEGRRDGTLEGGSSQTLSPSPRFPSLCALTVGVHPERLGAFSCLQVFVEAGLQTRVFPHPPRSTPHEPLIP